MEHSWSCCILCKQNDNPLSCHFCLYLIWSFLHKRFSRREGSRRSLLEDCLAAYGFIDCKLSVQGHHEADFGELCVWHFQHMFSIRIQTWSKDGNSLILQMKLRSASMQACLGVLVSVQVHTCIIWHCTAASSQASDPAWLVSTQSEVVLMMQTFGRAIVQ